MDSQLKVPVPWLVRAAESQERSELVAKLAELRAGGRAEPSAAAADPARMQAFCDPKLPGCGPGS